MKRALLISGDYEGDETVLTVDREELEYLLYQLRTAQNADSRAPSPVGRRLEIGLANGLEAMRVHARADGAEEASARLNGAVSAYE